ncbi:MAG: peroxiredoxin family protein [Planctomycetota bacterium]|nr:peroxiredoxin family protein [Planctomycetota bacterium]
MAINPLTVASAILITAMIGAPVCAQEATTQIEGILSDDQPRQPPSATRLVGTVNFPITCEKGESQGHFNQGVAFLHGGATYEAERCFRQVASLEPKVAMAYWGMAMANITHPDRAVGFVKSAMRRRAQAGTREQQFIDAIANYFEVTAQSLTVVEVVEDEDEPDPTRFRVPTFRRPQQDRARRLTSLHRGIVTAYPDDPEATAFLIAQQLRNRDLGLPPADPEEIDGQLDKLLHSNSRHPAHLYRMRLWLPTQPRRALISANMSPTAAPGSAEHWRTAGEVWARCGSNHRAIRHRRSAMRLDHARMARYQEMPFRVEGYAANLEALCADYRRVGQVREALTLAKYMIALPRHPKFNRPSDRKSLAGRGAAVLIETCREFRMLDELQKLASQGYFDTGVDRRASVHVTAGLTSAYLDLGEVKTAKSLLPRVTALRADVWDAATARSIDQAMREQLALLAVREGRTAQALEALQASGMRITQLSDCYEVLGMPARARQVLLTAAASSLDVPTLARLVALPPDPGNNKTRELFDRLRTTAAHSDLSLPLLQRLAPLAEKLGFPNDWRNPGSVQAPALENPRLGPARWQAPIARNFELTRSNGKDHRLSSYRGRPIVVLFYLGFGCLHCVEQLRDFQPHVETYRKAGLEILTIGTDTVQNMQTASAELPYAEKFAYTMLSDAKAKVFREWTSFDFFANETMHGTFLIDDAGRMLFQDISHEPFNHPTWFLAECQRLLGQGK